jgi:putative transposase
MEAIETFKTSASVIRLCEAMDVVRATAYRFWDRQRHPVEKKVRSPFIHPRALSQDEKQAVVDVVNSRRFQDSAPAQIQATLLDEGKYLCSVRTIHRILSALGQTKERRKRTDRKHHPMPELLATGSNQVWSWDITKLLGPQKWTYFYLYVMMDIFSRYVVGWMIGERESADLARILIEDSMEKQNISRDHKLTIHSDRGAPMTAKTVTQLMADLGVIKSLSRPRVSNDNPFSESHFSTIKGCPTYPGRFGSIQDARLWGRNLFPWYNDEHKHSGIGYYTAQSVHYGQAKEFYELRKQTLLKAYEEHPERFVNKIPKPHDVPEKVWINPPVKHGGTQRGMGMDESQKIDPGANMAVIFKQILPKGGEITRTGANSSLIDLKRLSHFG